MELVVFVGEDKENWGQITAIINRTDADNIFVVRNKEVEGFPLNEKCIEVKIDSKQPLLKIKEDLLEKFRDKLIGDFEVALSIASGTGKEHMALISALLSVPVGIRFVVFTKEGIQFVN